MSRTQAAGKLRKRRVGGRTLRVREGGAIDWTRVRADLRHKGIELRGGAADEAPGAYKRLDEVLAHHAGSVRILHTLHADRGGDGRRGHVRSVQGLEPARSPWHPQRWR